MVMDCLTLTVGTIHYPETSVTTNQSRETSHKIEELIYTVQEPEIMQTQNHTVWGKCFLFFFVARCGSHVRYICIWQCYQHTGH